MAKITSKITSIEEAREHIAVTPHREPKTADHAVAIEPVAAPQNRSEMRHPTADTINNFANATPPQSGTTWIKVVTIVSVCLWIAIAAIISLSLLDVGAQYKTYTALQWMGLAGLFFAPLITILVAAYSFKQLANLSAHAQILAQAAHALSQPDKEVLEKSEIMTGAIARQVDHVNEKLNASFGRLSSLETVLSVQADTLSKSNTDAKNTAESIAQALHQQEQGLNSISNTFDERMGALSLMITDHTNKLAEATQLAEQKIKEARISVEGAAAKINSASDIVRSNTMQATSTLSASHADISSLGDIIRERGVELDVMYKKHAGDLTSMIEYLRDEQQNLGAIFEDRLTIMRDLSLSAQASAESLSEASEAGKDTIEALAKAASLADNAVKTRFQEMQDMVQYSSENAQSISDKAAQRVKDSLELTRKEIGRIEDDMADLQNRLNRPNNHSLELVPDDSVQMDDDHATRTQKKRRWSRLKLKPIEDEALQAPYIESIDAESIQPVSASLDKAIVTSQKEVKESEEQDKGIETKHEALDLYMEPEEILSKPAFVPSALPDSTDDSQNPSSTDTVRRALPLDAERKEKSGFSFRNIFRKDEKPTTKSSLDIVNAPSMPSPLAENKDHSTSDILPALRSLGLTPNVVVDDGSVILAASSRAKDGHDAMSRIIIARLKDPVEHMAKALSIDAQLSQDTIAFATGFDQSVEAHGHDHQAIRSHLESEHGRAYLLCDAALNFGRV